MRLRWVVLIVAGVVGGIIYGELVRDIRAPTASLAQSHAITSNVTIRVDDDLLPAIEAMKKKYGPDAETGLVTGRSAPARIVTRLNGKVVEERKAVSQFSNAAGLFVVGPAGHLESTFPFQIDPRKAPDTGRKGEPSVRSLKSRFGKEFPAEYLEFDDRNAVTERCLTTSSADLGAVGRLLQFQSSTFCVVSWKGASPGSMLVGVALANGDPWMRPFTRRICRWLTAGALARLASTDRKPPDYAACVLVDRPDRTGAAEVLKAHVYEVGRDATLAYIN